MIIIKKIIILIIVSVMVISVCYASADTLDYNVSENAQIELDGDFFTGGWGGGIIADPQTIVDGIFLPSGNQWDQGSVWWDCKDNSAKSVLIKLDKFYEINSFIAQVDDNDAYTLYYYNIINDSWEVAWDIPNYNHLGWGMLTRPNINNNTERHYLDEPIATNILKLEGNLDDGDKYFAVSELQVFGIEAKINAGTDIKPNTLNLKSRSSENTIIAHMDFFDVDSTLVDVSSIKMSIENVLIDVQSGMINVLDYDHDGINELIVHFNRAEVVEALDGKTGNIDISILGKLTNGYTFKAIDNIRAINSGND